MRLTGTSQRRPGMGTAWQGVRVLYMHLMNHLRTRGSLICGEVLMRCYDLTRRCTKTQISRTCIVPLPGKCSLSLIYVPLVCPEGDLLDTWALSQPHNFAQAYLCSIMMPASRANSCSFSHSHNQKLESQDGMSSSRLRAIVMSS